MKYLRSLKSSLEREMTGGRSVCLWFSGGKDSLLLLKVMLDLGLPFAVLRFDHGWTAKQKKQCDALLVGTDVQTFSYPPREVFMIGRGDEISLVAGYAVDAAGNYGFLLRDVVDDPKRCAFDVKIPLRQPPAAPILFDLHVLGTKRSDSHYSLEDEAMLQSQKWNVGRAEFFAPLADWTDQDVVSGLKKYKTRPTAEDTGDIRACTNCLKAERAFCPKVGEEIAGVEWDREGNLRQFQSRW